FLSYLRHYPDSLIERKFGLLKAREISDMISDLEMELCRSDIPGGYETQLLEIDRQLKRDLINPGTSADLTAASIFAAGLGQL
ncbi:MAG: triphosphoribosyl-dephospho-CoA synthase, partial [Gammaproteobacteria bacterium]|nr:triphosphoribosyl-dephospho-CoA synthase [Gammaproteobacteria bacterium]